MINTEKIITHTSFAQVNKSDVYIYKQIVAPFLTRVSALVGTHGSEACVFSRVSQSRVWVWVCFFSYPNQTASVSISWSIQSFRIYKRHILIYLL